MACSASSSLSLQCVCRNLIAHLCLIVLLDSSTLHVVAGSFRSEYTTAFSMLLLPFATAMMKHCCYLKCVFFASRSCSASSAVVIGRILSSPACFLACLHLNAGRCLIVWNQNCHYLMIFFDSFVVAELTFVAKSDCLLILRHSRILHLNPHAAISNWLDLSLTTSISTVTSFLDTVQTIAFSHSDYCFANSCQRPNPNSFSPANSIGHYSPTFLKFAI